jgi:hypothetical protein
MGAKVTVACKMPLGFVLHLDTMVDVDEPVMGGGVKTVKRARKRLEAGEVILRGPLQSDADKAAGVQPPLVVGSYALNPGIDKEWFDEWLRLNQDADVVRNKLIFATKPASVQSQAKDQKTLRTGLEPLNPAMRIEGDRKVPVDPRFPRTMSRNLTNVESAERDS